MQENIIIFLRLLFLMASNFGYYNLLRKKTNLDVSFIPMITIAIQFVILFLAGLLNLLLTTAVILLAAGVLLFAMDICHKKLGEYKNFAVFSYVYMGICIMILLLALTGKFFTHIDDFSHWATVIRQLMTTNQYPNYASEMVDFKTYPLGSATYIYYCCLLAGTDEWIQMLIQAFMMVCAIMPLFSCIHSHKIGGFFLLILFTNIALVYNTPLAALLVDTLLPLFGMGTLLIIYQISHSVQKFGANGENRDIWVAVPLLAMTVMIKNSGFFFAVPSMIAVVCMWRKHRTTNIVCAAVFATPMITSILWKQHCLYVFKDAMLNKHTVSIQNYAIGFHEKTKGDILSIGLKMIQFMMAHLPAVYLLLSLLLITAIGCMIYKDKKKQSWIFLTTMAGVYLLYMIGLYGMYIFSMPLEEAEQLAEISRYVKTADLAVLYVTAAYMLMVLNGITNKKKYAAMLAVVFALLIFLEGSLTNWKIISGKENPYPRKWLDEQIEKYDIPMGAICLVYNSLNDGDEYLCNILSYLLWSPSVYWETGINEDNTVLLNNFQYIVMIDYTNDVLNGWIQAEYPEQYGNSVIITK